MNSRFGRRLLWFSGWLVWLPVAGYGISTGNLLLAFVVGPPLFLASLYFSLQKLVCPQCNHAIRTIGTQMSNCMKCGAAFANDNGERQALTRMTLSAEPLGVMSDILPKRLSNFGQFESRRRRLYRSAGGVAQRSVVNCLGVQQLVVIKIAAFLGFHMLPLMRNLGMR